MRLRKGPPNSTQDQQYNDAQITQAHTADTSCSQSHLAASGISKSPFVDPAASDRMNTILKHSFNFKSLAKPRPVRLLDCSVIMATDIGSVRHWNMVRSEVLYLSDLKCNLISVVKATRSGLNTAFNSKEDACLITDGKTGQRLAKVPYVNDMFDLRIQLRII